MNSENIPNPPKKDETLWNALWSYVVGSEQVLKAQRSNVMKGG